MGRFILIDHSLIDYSGHHYEYARAVLDAAAEAGLRPVLLANRRFKPEREEAWPIIPAYKYGVWLHQGPRWQRPLHACAAGVRRLGGRRTSATDALDGSASRGRRGELIRGWLSAHRSRQFVGDTERALRGLALTGDDVVLAPTISFDEFYALRRQGPFRGSASRANWHFVFRRDFPAEHGSQSNQLGAAFGPGAVLDGPHRWRLWTDSEELSARYSDATGRQFGTLPIPHAGSSRAVASEEGAFRILYLGDARREKGFHHLPALVKSLNDKPLNCETPRRFAFSIQAHMTSPAADREIIEARDELRRLANLGVALFTRPLDPVEYRRLLESGQLCLLPYDREAYAARSSGVFAESLAAGIPTIVPAETWMSRRQPPTSGLIYRSLEEIPERVREIADRFQQYKQGANRAAEAWSQRHSARELLSQLGCPKS